MTNNNLLTPNNSLNNAVQSINKIKIVMRNGVITGNIIDGVIDTRSNCIDNLDFSCQQNSQYLPLI